MLLTDGETVPADRRTVANALRRSRGYPFLAIQF
jgi:hypothetical protein